MGVGTLVISFGIIVSAGAASAAGPMEPLPPETRAFCSAVEALEDAVAIDNQAARHAAIALVMATAPDHASVEAIDQLAATIDGAPLDPAYIDAHTALIEAAVGTCDIPTVTVRASGREYQEVPDAVGAGETVFIFDNPTTETHWFWVGFIPEGADYEEILELPEEERNQYEVAEAIVAPTDTGSDSELLQAGHYVAACIMVEDADSEMVAEILETGTVPDDAGPPHWENGMFQEFEVI